MFLDWKARLRRRARPKRYRPRQRYRLNHQITSPRLRLLDETGKQIGIVNKIEALQKAKALDLDVVEIAPKADPPVAKLIDFKKFKYQEAKKKREEKKSQKNVGLKEVRLRPFTGEHDFNTILDRAREFLDEGNQLKINIFFKGREIIRKKFGHETLKKFIDSLEDVKIVREPHMEGRKLCATVAKEAKKK